jgi:hypothetical protein
MVIRTLNHLQRILGLGRETVSGHVRNASQIAWNENGGDKRQALLRLVSLDIQLSSIVMISINIDGPTRPSFEASPILNRRKTGMRLRMGL